MKRRIHFVVLGILFHFTKEEEEVNKDISIHIYVDTRKNKEQNSKEKIYKRILRKVSSLYKA